MHWLREVLKNLAIPIHYIRSNKQAADIFTKAFLQLEPWIKLCNHIGIFDPVSFRKIILSVAVLAQKTLRDGLISKVGHEHPTYDFSEVFCGWETSADVADSTQISASSAWSTSWINSGIESKCGGADSTSRRKSDGYDGSCSGRAHVRDRP